MFKNSSHNAFLTEIHHQNLAFMQLLRNFRRKVQYSTRIKLIQGEESLLGPEHTGHFVQPHVAAHCGGDIYSRRKPLFSSFGEDTAVCGSSVRQAVARPRHRQSVCIHNIHDAATCRPSVLGTATMRGHMWLNKVASVLGPLRLQKMSSLFKLQLEITQEYLLEETLQDYRDQHFGE